MSRIVLLDVDGTLVDYDGTVPPSARDAVRAARRNGHRVLLSTGRSRAEIYDDLWEIGLDGLIGANGGYVEVDGEVVWHQSITADQNRRFVDWLQDRGLEFYLEANSGLYASRDFERAAAPVMQAYLRGKGTPGAATMTTRDAFPDMIFGADPYRDDVNKISYILSDLADHEAAEQAFPEFEHRTWGGRGSHALFGDVAVKGITKKHAVDVLLAHLDADLGDTIAFGDAAVDASMLEYCAVGVAMGNAPDDVKAVADLVTSDVADDGLARAFGELGLV